MTGHGLPANPCGPRINSGNSAAFDPRAGETCSAWRAASAAASGDSNRSSPGGISTRALAPGSNPAPAGGCGLSPGFQPTAYLPPGPKTHSGSSPGCIAVTMRRCRTSEPGGDGRLAAGRGAPPTRVEGTRAPSASHATNRPSGDTRRRVTACDDPAPAGAESEFPPRPRQIVRRQRCRLSP